MHQIVHYLRMIPLWQGASISVVEVTAAISMRCRSCIRRPMLLACAVLVGGLLVWLAVDVGGLRIKATLQADAKSPDVRARADVNGDGLVDYADAAIVRVRPSGAFRCDVNADGRVNRADYELVLSIADLPDGQLGYKPVRKVIAHMRTWNGSWKNNPQGFTPWWALDQGYEKAVATLKRKIEVLARGAGVRQFSLKLPGGSVPPRMCSSQFWPMPEERRELLRKMARELKAEYPDIQLGVYVGWGLDPTPETIEMSGWRFPDWNSPEDRAAVVHLYKGWGDIGFDFLIIDAISPQASLDGTALTWLRYLEKECGVRTIGEAFPLLPGRLSKAIDEDLMDQHAWTANKRFVDRHRGRGHPTGARYLGFNGHVPGWKDSQTKRLKMISEAIEQGFIPGIYDFGRPPMNVELFKHAVDALAKHDAVAR